MKGLPFGNINVGTSRSEVRSRRRFLLPVLMILVAIFAAGLFAWLKSRSAVGPTEAAPIAVKTETSPSTMVVPEESARAIGTSAPYQSEHYRAGEIAIGGEMALFVPESDSSPLSIGSVRGEAFSAKGKAGSKLVVSWETNKPARSEIAYGKGVGQAEAVIREEEFGTNHSVIIPDVSPASTYVYVISAKDKWGGDVKSDPYAVYTGAREISLFELIAGAVGEVFGWAVDKG